MFRLKIFGNVCSIFFLILNKKNVKTNFFLEIFYFFFCLKNRLKTYANKNLTIGSFWGGSADRQLGQKWGSTTKKKVLSLSHRAYWHWLCKGLGLVARSAPVPTAAPDTATRAPRGCARATEGWRGPRWREQEAAHGKMPDSLDNFLNTVGCT